MTWLASHVQPRWRWLMLNLAALAIFVYVMTQGRDWRTTEGFDSMMASGKWGVRFLLLSLTMTPLHTYLRWSGALKLRKPAGLWAFAFGAAHLTLYAIETWQPLRIHQTNGTPWGWLSWPLQLHIAVGLLAFGILAALALTSNKWAMRKLGKNWKRLHRIVYCAGIGVIVHVLLASAVSKKMIVRDPNAVTEMSVYLGVLAIFLVVFSSALVSR